MESGAESGEPVRGDGTAPGYAEDMLNVSIVIPAWNEQERIVDCLNNALRQTVAPYEVIVVDNRSTDDTVAVVERYIADHPGAPVRLLHQDGEQGLIPTRDAGLDAAAGDVLGRIDADCMLRPDWVETVAGIFADDPEAMGATGPVMYYDMPGRRVGLRGDDHIRRHTYRADGDEVLLFGSNMALRADAWRRIAGEVCSDRDDVMHEDIDISLHLLGDGLKTVYSQRMVCGISARRMDTSFRSFHRYMKRFRTTFEAHPDHWRERRSERRLYAMYPWLHMLYPVYQKLLAVQDVNPAERVWFREQMELVRREFDLDAGVAAGSADVCPSAEAGSDDASAVSAVPAAMSVESVESADPVAAPVDVASDVSARE